MRRLIVLAAVVVFLALAVPSSIAYALDDYTLNDYTLNDYALTYGGPAPDQFTEAGICSDYCKSSGYVSGKPISGACDGDPKFMPTLGVSGCCCSPKTEPQPLPVTSTPKCQEAVDRSIKGMKGVCATSDRYPGRYQYGRCEGENVFCYAVDPDNYCNDACRTNKYIGGRCLPFVMNRVLNEFSGSSDYVDVIPIGQQFCNVALEGRLGMPSVPNMCYCGGVGFGNTPFVKKVYAECIDMGNGQSNVVFSFMWGGQTATSAAVSADGGTSQSYYKARIGNDFQYVGDVRTDFYQSVVPSAADKKARITVNIARGNMPYSYGSYGNSKYSQPGYGSAYGYDTYNRYYSSYPNYNSNPAFNANFYGSSYSYGSAAYSRSFTVQCTSTGSKQGTTEFAYDKAVDEYGGYTGREALAATQEETGLPAQLIEKIYCTSSGTRKNVLNIPEQGGASPTLPEAVASIASLLETEGVESAAVQDAIKAILPSPRDYTNVLLAATNVNTDACLLIMSKKQTVYGIEVNPRKANSAFIFEDLVIDGTRIEDFYEKYKGAPEGQTLFKTTDAVEGRVIFFDFAEKNNGMAAVPKDIKPYVYAPLIKTAVDKMNKDLGQHIAVTGSLVTIEGQAGFFESLCYGGKSICADFKSVGCKTDFLEAKCGSFPSGYKKISGNCGGFWGGVLGKAVGIAASLYLGDAVGGAVSSAVGGTAGEALGQFSSAMVRQEIAKVTGVMAPLDIYGFSGSMPAISFSRAEKNEKCEFWAGENPLNAPECKGYSLKDAWENEQSKLITMVGYAAVSGKASGICVGKKVTETSCKPVAAQPPSYSYCGGLVTVPYPADPAKPEESAMGIWPCRYYCSREGMTTIGNLTVNINMLGNEKWSTDVSTADAGKFTYMFLAPAKPGAYTLKLTSNIKPYKGFAEDVSPTVADITLIVREPEKPKVEIVRSECGAEDEALNCKDTAYQCGSGEKIYYKIRITNPVDEDVTHDQTDFAVDITGCTEGWACEIRDRVIRVAEGITEETVLSIKPLANAKGTGEAKITVRDPVHYGKDVEATARYLYHEKKSPVLDFTPASLSGDLDHPQELILNITNKDNAKCNGDRFSVFTTAPENWEITKKKDGNLVDSVVVRAGATESLNVKIVPKKTATGKQSILFSVMRGTPERLLSSVENVRDFKVYADGRYIYFNEAGMLRKMATGEQPQEISSNVLYFDVDEKTTVFDPASFENTTGESSIYIGPEYPSIPAAPGKIILTPYGNKWNFVSLTNAPEQALTIKAIEDECGPVKIWKYGGNDYCSGPDMTYPCQLVYQTTSAVETVPKDIARNLGIRPSLLGSHKWVSGYENYGIYGCGGSGFIANSAFIDVVDRSGSWPVGEQKFIQNGDTWEWCWKGGAISCSSLSDNGEITNVFEACKIGTQWMKVKISKESGTFRVQQWGNPCIDGGIKYNAYCSGTTAAEKNNIVAPSTIATLTTGEAYQITVSKKCDIETIGRDYKLEKKQPTVIKIISNKAGEEQTISRAYFAGPTEPIDYNKIRGTCPDADAESGPLFYNQLSKTWEFTTLVEPGRGYFIKTAGCSFHRCEETDGGLDAATGGVLTIDGEAEYKDSCVSGKLKEYYCNGVLEDLSSSRMSEASKSFSYGLTVTGTDDYITDWKTLFAVNTPAFHDGDLNSQEPGKIWLVDHNQQLQVNSDGSWKIITDKDEPYGLFDLEWNGRSWISSNELHSGTFSFENNYPSEPVAFDVIYIGSYTESAEPIAVSHGAYRKPSSDDWHIERWNKNSLLLTGYDNKKGRAGFFYTVKFKEHINQEIKATLPSRQGKVSFSEGEKLIADETIQLVFSAPLSVVKEIIKAGLKIDIKDDDKYVKVWEVLDNENVKYTETSTTRVADVPVRVYACIDEDQNDVCDYQETVHAKSITKSCDEFCAEENPFMVGTCKEDQFGVGQCACKPKSVPGADVYYIYAREGEEITYELVKSSGGRTTILATGLENPKDIAVGSEYIYWTEYVKGVIYKVPKAGGAVAVEKTGLVNPVGLDYNGNLTYTEIGLRAWTVEAPIPVTVTSGLTSGYKPAVPEVYYAAPSWYALEGKRSVMIVGDRTTKIKQDVGAGTIILHARSDETTSIAVSINGLKTGACSVSAIWTRCSFNVSAGELAIYPDTDKKTIVLVDDVSAANGGFEDTDGKVVGRTVIAVKNPMDVSVDNDIYSTSYSDFQGRIMKGSEVIASPVPEPVKIHVSGDKVYWTEGPGAIMYMKKDMLGAEKELAFTLEGFIAPSIEAEATLQGVAGKELTYEITIKRSSAEPAYLSSPVTYTIETVVPENWTASADKKTITLSRGQSEKIKLTVKSTLTALKGTYPVTLRAVSKQVSSEKTLYYEVIEYAVTGAAVFITPEKITKSQDEAGAVRYAVRLSNTNPKETLPLVFYTTVEAPEAWLASLAGIITVAPQSSESMDLDVTPLNPSDGLYKINVIFSTEKPVVSEAISGITDMQVVTLAGAEYIYYNANGAIKRMYYVNTSGAAGPTKQVKTIVYSNAKAFFVDSQYVYYIYEDSSTKEIRRIRNDGVGEAVTMVKGLDNPVDIAVTNYIYWTENTKGKIMRASKNQNTLADFSKSYAVADNAYAIYAANDIYWSDSSGIVRCQESCSSPTRVMLVSDVTGIFVSDDVYYTTYEKKGYGKLWKGTSLLAGGIEAPKAVSVSGKAYFADSSGIKSISKAAFAVMGAAVYEISGLPAAKGCGNAPLMLQKDSQLIARPADTLRYGLTIRNRDEAGCPFRGFFLTIEAASGWSAVIESGLQLRLNASRSADAKLAVTSPSSAPVGVYKTSLLVADVLPKASAYYTTGAVKDVMFKNGYMYYSENNEIIRSDGNKEKIVGNRAGETGRFVVDDAYVYWIETYGTPVVKSIYRIRNDGTGQISTIATHLSDPRYVAVDSENVYWSDSDGINYVSKASSCDSTCSSYAEAADARGVYSDGSLYWTDSGRIKPLNISADAVDVFVRGDEIYYTTGSQLWRYNMTTKKAQAMAINLQNAGGITADANNVYWADRYGIEMINVTAQSDYKTFSYIIRGEEICTDGIDNEDPDTLVDYYDVNDCCDMNSLDAFGRSIYGVTPPLGDGKCHTECGGDVDVECNGSSSGELSYCEKCKLTEGKNSRVCGDGVLNYQAPYREVCEAVLDASKWKCPAYKCAGAKTQSRTGCVSDCQSCTYDEGIYVKGSCGAECVSDAECGADKCVDGMCVKPSPVQCTLNGKCDETAELGVKFGGKVSGIAAPIIVACKADSTQEQCLADRSSNYCGSYYSGCLCSGWYGCEYTCSDNAGTYYLVVFDAFSDIPILSAIAKGDVYSTSSYHYQCPELHITEINDMRDDFDDIYKNVNDIQARFEVLILSHDRGSAEYKQYQQCISYSGQIVKEIAAFRSFVDNLNYRDITPSTFNQVRDRKKQAQDAIYGPDDAPQSGLMDRLQRDCIV